MVILSLLACTASSPPLDDVTLAAAVAVGTEVESDRLYQHVVDMVAAHDQDPGVYVESREKTHKHDLGFAALEATLRDAGFPPTVETTDEDGWFNQNLYVDLPGTTMPGELVVVSGHYDVWFSGADDDSSAIAVLLEALRVLSERETARTVRLVAFDNEELGLIGSTRYWLGHEADDVYAVVNMDAVSFAAREPGSQSAPTGFTLPDVGDFVVALCNEPAERHGLMAAQIAAALPEPLPIQGAIGTGDNRTPGTGDFHRSDHSGAWNRGIPAVFFSDTTNFRSELYHTPDDRPETIDQAFLHGVGQTVVGLTWALANDTGAP